MKNEKMGTGTVLVNAKKKEKVRKHEKKRVEECPRPKK